MLKKYNDILNEKKDMKAEKTGIEAKITKLLKDKPEVKASGNWPTAKCIYNISNIKKYVGEDNLKTDQVFNDMKKDKKIKSVNVKIAEYGETYPYFYHEDHTTKEEAEKCKVDMEKSQKPAEKKAVKSREVPERAVGKKKEVTPKPRAPRKPVEKKVVTEGDLKVKAKATVKRKK